MPFHQLEVRVKILRQVLAEVLWEVLHILCQPPGLVLNFLLDVRLLSKVIHVYEPQKPEFTCFLVPSYSVHQWRLYSG